MTVGVESWMRCDMLLACQSGATVEEVQYIALSWRLVQMLYEANKKLCTKELTDTLTFVPKR